MSSTPVGPVTVELALTMVSWPIFSASVMRATSAGDVGAGGRRARGEAGAGGEEREGAGGGRISRGL